MKRQIVIVLIVLILMATSSSSSPVSVEGCTDALVLSGNVEITETNMGFKLPGRVVICLLMKDNAVQSGQVLARLDSADDSERGESG